MLVFPLRMMSFMVAQISRASASAARVYEILATEPEIVERPDALPLPDGRGELRFEDVTFGYRPGRAGAARLRPRRRARGSRSRSSARPAAGKSTVARLVPRFYDVDDGTRAPRRRRRARPAARRAARRASSLVFEDTFLFTDTRAREHRVRRRRRRRRRDRAGGPARGRVTTSSRDLPDGYDTMLGEHGFSLSGGQRQRVAIARAILADPRVLILDDATSSVDPTKEHEIRDALAEVMRGRTTIIIAHRPATIALADRVVLIDDGTVAARGNARRAARDVGRATATVLAQVEAAEARPAGERRRREADAS